MSSARAESDDQIVLKLRRRRNRRRFILLLVAVVLGPYLVSRWRASFRVARVIGGGVPAVDLERVESVSVVIYNIAHGRGAVTSNLEEGGAAKRDRLVQIGEFLRDVDADIVILNEADFCSTWSGHHNQAQIIAEIAGYPHRGEQRNWDFRFIYGSLKFGNAILSRFPIEESSVINLPAERWWEPLVVGKKNAASFRLSLSSDQTLHVIPIHLEHRKEATRSQSVDQLLSHVSSTKAPVLLGGDFNSTPTGMPNSSTSDCGNAIDKLDASDRFARRSVSAERQNFTYSTSEPSTTIDWIMVTKPNSLVEYRVLETELSDHRPVFARIRLAQ